MVRGGRHRPIFRLKAPVPSFEWNRGFVYEPLPAIAHSFRWESQTCCRTRRIHLTASLVEQELEKVDRVLSVLEDYSRTGQVGNVTVIRQIMIDSLRIASGGPLVEEVIVHPFILWRFAYAVSDRLANDIGTKRLFRLGKLRVWEQSTSNYVRIRRFRPEGGVYWGFPFQAEDGHYFFWDDEPILLTRVSKEWLEEQRWGTELGWIVRPEVRMLASLSFPVEDGFCWFQLSNEVYDVPEDLIVGDEPALSQGAVERASIAMRILTRPEMADDSDFKSRVFKSCPYEFRTEWVSPENARKFYDCFDINDDLTLRIAFYLLKSVMLWNYEGQIFGEDACANLFFGLEGCLRLIHRRIFGTPNFEFQPTLAHIEDTFNMGYDRWLKDAHEKRVKIVHPEPRMKTGWLPSLMEDDFYENYEMAMDLVYYAVTGEILPRDDL